MASEVIKKSIIEKSFLPPVDYNSLGYNVRYRIISEDKNRTSHWSPTFNIAATAITTIQGALSKTASVITVVWDDPEDRPAYDVFVKFDSNALEYVKTVTSESYSFKNTGTTSVRVKIQVASSQKETNANLIIYDSTTVSLV
jgi:hypothetical protein